MENMSINRRNIKYNTWNCQVSFILLLCQSILLIYNFKSDSLCGELKQILLIRVQDKIPQVRVAAVLALHKLHDPTNKKDRIVKEFKRILSNDAQK